MIGASLSATQEADQHGKNMECRMRAYRMSVPAIAVLLLAVACMGQQASPTPADGRLVFESQGCLSCHAINGAGGTVGPDLGRQAHVSNNYDLAAKMWNHSPKMMHLMARTKTERPVFTGRAFRSLAEFLSYVRYLGRPGDAAAGKRLFSEKKCTACHSLGRSVAGKSPLDSLKVFVAPVRLAQAMWNHYEEMRTAGSTRTVPLPRFRDDEFSDLTAYIRVASAMESEAEVRSFIGDPVLGDSLFHQKGCYGCHVAQTIGPRLDPEGAGTIGLAKSLTEIAGAMWNHAGKMSSAMESAKQRFPHLDGDEMANIISFL